MKKRIISIVLVLILIFALGVTAVSAQPRTVNPTQSTVFVDGEAVEFRAYLIGGNNFCMLRALAYALNGTTAQFSVGWDGTTITLTSGQPYEVVGGETALGTGTPQTATPTAARLILDGEELNLTAYTIGGNNFFRLRDIMQALDVGVIWDEPAQAIRLDTSIGYAEAVDISELPPTPPVILPTDSGESFIAPSEPLVLRGAWDTMDNRFTYLSDNLEVAGGRTFWQIAPTGERINERVFERTLELEPIHEGEYAIFTVAFQHPVSELTGYISVDFANSTRNRGIEISVQGNNGWVLEENFQLIYEGW